MVKTTLRRNARRSDRAGTLTPEASIVTTDVMNPDSIHSPLNLHNADHPGMIIVSIQLDGSNYNQWCSAIKIALDAKNKISFIDGSMSRPAVSEPMFRIWSRCNSMVKSWLLNSVNKQIYGSILNFDDASQIWVDLHNRFHMTNLPRTFQLIQQIQDLRQGSMDLSGYYTQLKTLWDKLDGAEASEPCPCCSVFNCRGQEMAKAKMERGRIIKFLAGLSDRYAVIRGQIIMKKPLPNLAEIYNMLDQDDSQRCFSSAVAPTAYQVSQNVQPSVLNDSHNSHDVSQPGVLNVVQKKAKPICSHCGYSGHVVDRCYKLHGYPVGYKKGKNNGDKQGQSSSVVAAQVSASDNAMTGNLDNLIGNLNKEQIQNFIAYFSSQLHAHPTVTSVSSTPTNNNPSGSYQGIGDW